MLYVSTSARHPRSTTRGHGTARVVGPRLAARCPAGPGSRGTARCVGPSARTVTAPPVLAGEGNVIGVPLFVLNNKAARVRCADPTDREALARAYTRRIVRTATLPDGTAVERTITVVANPVFGNPTDLAQRIFHVLIARWEAQGRPADPCVYVTRAGLCRALGVQVSGRELDRVEHQLRALKAVSVEFVDAWYAKTDPRERGTWAPGKKTISIIADWSFEPRAAGRPAPARRVAPRPRGSSSGRGSTPPCAAVTSSRSTSRTSSPSTRYRGGSTST